MRSERWGKLLRLACGTGLGLTLVWGSAVALEVADSSASAPAAAQAPPPAPGGAPSRAQVASEVAALRAARPSPHTEKTLRFKPRPDPDKKTVTPRTDSSIARWLKSFGQWASDLGRVIVWGGMAVLVLVLLFGLRHWMRLRAGAVTGTAAARPLSHVRDLDIRPASLPEHIGEAAAALWQQGKHRAALSLLYRGALSRLVHQHRLPIRSASTEGECLALAATRLPDGLSAYFAGLVDAWQRAVYGAHLPEADHFLALCRDFDRHWPAPRTVGSPP